MSMHILRTITPLLWRVIVFLCFFLLISGIIGPRVISGDILFRDGFAIYGGFGKAAIFSAIAFVLLARQRKVEITLQPWRPVLGWWMLAAAALLVLAWVSIGHLLVGERGLQNLAGAHGGLVLGLILIAIGCMGPKNMRLVWQSYRREILISMALGAVFYAFLLAVYALWRPLSSVVLVSVRAMLELIGLQSTFVPPHTLLFDKFGITVAQYCSGIESIALFTSLYAVVGLLDWGRLRKKRYFIIFPFALLLLFLLNIVRVFALIVAGYYINPQIAFSLFHTYAGLVFFIVYSAAFWAIAYKHLLEKPATHGFVWKKQS